MDFYQLIFWNIFAGVKSTQLVSDHCDFFIYIKLTKKTFFSTEKADRMPWCELYVPHSIKKPCPFTLKQKAFFKIQYLFISYSTNAVPPDILDADSSKDITVTEGQNATLYCAASGNPKPRKFNPINWLKLITLTCARIFCRNHLATWWWKSNNHKIQQQNTTKWYHWGRAAESFEHW